MIPKNNLLLAGAVLTTVLAAQAASAQLVTNTVQNSQGVGVRTTDLANPPAATYPQQFDKAVTRGYNNDPSKAWIQFDLSSAWATYGQGNLVSATLTLWGENGTGRDFNVYGLADSAGLEGWERSTTYWTNAPGNDVNSAGGFALANVDGGAPLWTAGGGGVDLAYPAGGSGTDQCARYTGPDFSAFLATDTDGLVTFMWTGGNNQNWWVGPGGTYVNEPIVANGVIIDSPTLTLVFTNAPVNAPVFTDIMRVGGNVILQGTNGVPQGAYQMLHSTDLSQPVASWSGLGINSFETNGNFNFTNALPADAASFYRLMTLSSGPVFPPAITEQPQDFATSVGNNATFNVTATGTPLAYRWFFNTNTPLPRSS